MDGNIAMRYSIPEEDYIYSGHSACPGCGAVLAMRFVLKALGARTIVVVPASCSTGMMGNFPLTSLKIPLIHMPFETGGAAGAGLKAALDMKGKSDINVLVWAGDGGTFDIGLQSLSGAGERNDDFIYVCYDNEAYMNTGIQRSSATPMGSWTTTTPIGHPKNTPKKDIIRIMVAHRIPYAATATVAYPDDLYQKLKKATKYRGLKFIHILSPCPTGWRFPSEFSIDLSRLAVETKVFPLYEVENGTKYVITKKPKGLHVKEFLIRQGRFKHLSDEDIESIQENVEREWNYLLCQTAAVPGLRSKVG